MTDKKTEALKLALEALKIGYDYAVDETQRFHVEMAGYKPKRHEAMDADVRQIDKAIAVIDEALAEQQEPVAAIRSLTDQCAALIQERNELQKQVWRYEKNGVTCQTYQHRADRTCSECNVHEDYTSPPPLKPWVGLTEYDIEYPYPPAKPPVYATAMNTKAVRDGFELGGYEKEAGYYSEAQLDEFARTIEAKLKEKNT